MCVVRLFSSLPRRVRLCVFCNSVFCWGLGPIHCCIFGFRPYLIIFSFFVVGSFLAFLVVLAGGMPPKSKRNVEGKSEEAGEDDGGSASSVSSPLSVASSASSLSSAPVTTEHLERIIEANRRSMEALLAALPSALAAVPTPPVHAASSPKISHIPVPKWTDSEIPNEFFNKYEQAQKHNGVEKSQWGHLLPVYLSGRAQASFGQVDPATLDDYEMVKEIMLESLGDTPASADRKWWTLSRASGEDPGAFYLRVRALGIRRFHGLKTREEVCEKSILSRFLSLLPPECYSFVVSKQPKNGQEASRLALEFEETKTFARRFQPWRSGGAQQGSSTYSIKREEGSKASSTSGVPSSTQGQGSSSSQASVVKSEKHEKLGKKERKPISCYGCGEPGHIRPNCPNKVRRVKPKTSGVSLVVDGVLAGTAVSGLRIDTGADRTVVSSEYVPESAYTGRSIQLDSWRGGQPSKHKLALIKVKVGSAEVEKEVAVAESLDCPALLGTDLGKEFLSAMLVPLLTEPDKVVVEASGASGALTGGLVRSTRAQVCKQQKSEKEDLEASAQSEATPVPWSDILDFRDSYFEQDIVSTPVEEWSTLPEVSVVEVPLPCLEPTEGDNLVEEQQADVSLEKLLELAQRGEKGYDFNKGIFSAQY